MFEKRDHFRYFISQKGKKSIKSGNSRAFSRERHLAEDLLEIKVKLRAVTAPKLTAPKVLSIIKTFLLQFKTFETSFLLLFALKLNCRIASKK